jgi:hypothetical protein
MNYVRKKPYLTQCFNQSVLESQLPHKTVNWISLSVIVNKKLTILWGSRLPKIDQWIPYVRQNPGHAPHRASATMDR